VHRRPRGTNQLTQAAKTRRIEKESETMPNSNLWRRTKRTPGIREFPWTYLVLLALFASLVLTMSPVR